MVAVLFGALLLISGIYGIISLVKEPKELTSGIFGVVFSLGFAVGFTGCGFFLYKDVTRRNVLIALIALFCAITVMFVVSLAGTAVKGGNVVMNVINLMIGLLGLGLSVTGICLKDE
jgi:uncharacterized membrane protein HdeD (DUF308 family)